MPSPRKKNRLAKPFVISVTQVAVTMLAPGCVLTEQTNPPPAVCPTAMPANGASCLEPMNCSYGTDACGVALSASCANGTWQVTGPVICNPPPPDPMCPMDLPAVGAMCNWNWQAGAGCSYTVDNGCGPQNVSVLCNATSVTVEYASPPLCGQCTALTEAACGTDSGCRWLTPGCGMNPLAAAGCFPVADCVDDTSCTTAGQTCQELSYNPCYMKACDACGASAKVCAPAPMP